MAAARPPPKAPGRPLFPLRSPTHASLLLAVPAAQVRLEPKPGRGARPIDEVLTDVRVSEAFGVAVSVERRGGRWAARSGAGPGS